VWQNSSPNTPRNRFPSAASPPPHGVTVLRCAPQTPHRTVPAQAPQQQVRVAELGAFRAQEFAPRRRVVKQIGNLNACRRAACAFAANAALPTCTDQP
jgi:hypothetical protein